MTRVTDEEILKHLEKAKKISEEDSQSDVKKKRTHKDNATVLKFIKEMGISSGNIRVPFYKVFFEYRIKWKGIYRSYKVNKKEFGRTFSKYFDRVRSGIGLYYMLDDCFDMSKEALKEAKLYDIQYGQGRSDDKRKKKNRKRKSKESSPKETIQSKS